MLPEFLRRAWAWVIGYPFTRQSYRDERLERGEKGNYWYEIKAVDLPPHEVKLTDIPVTESLPSVPLSAVPTPNPFTVSKPVKKPRKPVKKGPVPKKPTLKPKVIPTRKKAFK